MEETFDIPKFKLDIPELLDNLRPKTDKKIKRGKGKEEYENGFIYKGQFKGGQRNGKGKLITNEPIKGKDHIFEGRFVNGEISSGTYTAIQSTSGEKIIDYNGEFSNNQFNGEGNLKIEDFLEYNGSFKNGKFHTINKKDGSLKLTKDNEIEINMVGQFNEGKREGLFVIDIKKNNKIYYQFRGKFQNDKREGSNFYEKFFGFEEKLNPERIKEIQGTYEDNELVYGEKVFENGIRYKGEFKSCKYEGKGELFYKDNKLMFTGNFKNGLKHGKGKLIMENDDEFIGYFENDTLNGEGEYYKKGKLLYKGEFKDGLKDGEGEEYDENAELIYKGEFSSDKYNGNGTLTKNGQKYIGSFKDGLKNGEGILYYKNGDVYEGEFLCDSKSGKNCKYKWKDGKTFYGEFKGNKLYNGVLEKKGENGYRYEGNFTNGVIEGKGAYTDNITGITTISNFKNQKPTGATVKKLSNGITYEINYNNQEIQTIPKILYDNNDTFEIDDKFENKEEREAFINTLLQELPQKGFIRNLKGTYKFNDGNVNYGEHQNNYLNDKNAKITYKNGDKYEGEIRNGEKDGKGVYIWSNGDIYEGEWKNGCRHGQGKLTTNDQIFTGNFNNGKIDGIGIRLYKKTGKKYKQKYENGTVVKEYMIHSNKNINNNEEE